MELKLLQLLWKLVGGSGEPFDYKYDIPIEDIDLTFNKPYMFLIRDKKTQEVFFVGTVYNPLEWKNEDENKQDRHFSIFPEITKK